MIATLSTMPPASVQLLCPLFGLLVGLPAPANPLVHTAAPACAPTHVEVTPVVGANYSVYEGRTQTHRIRFISERPGQKVDAFPEPPVRIVRRASGAACVISEGGVWGGSGVYSGAGGRRFLLLETSGSGATVTVYDADSCVRKAEIDVSEARWRFTPGGVEIGRQCKGSSVEDCNFRHVTTLTADCTPARD